jgi:hypothetical protein
MGRREYLVPVRTELISKETRDYLRKKGTRECASSKGIRRAGGGGWMGGVTLKNLPEAWRRWKLLQASDDGGGGEAVVVGKGDRWWDKEGLASTSARRSSQSKSRQWYSASASCLVLSRSPPPSMAATVFLSLLLLPHSPRLGDGKVSAAAPGWRWGPTRKRRSSARGIAKTAVDGDLFRSNWAKKRFV